MANTQKTKQVAQRVFQNLKNLKNTKFDISVLKKINYKVAVLIAIPLLVIIFIFTTIISILSKSAANSSAQTTTNTSLIPPSGIAQINKDFTFSLKDTNGKKIGSFTYTLQNAELDKQIIVQGSKATAITGRIFLVINLKLTNSEDNGLSVNTKDYVRLSVNGSSEQLAPEIHNDPVEVQAISTKYTRVGFAIDTSDKDYLLKVGEIDEPKTDIKLHFVQ